MGDNIEEIEPEGVIQLSNLPHQYQHHLTELQPVIKSLFAKGGGEDVDCDGSGDSCVDEDVLKFVEMCHQVFDLDYHTKAKPSQGVISGGGGSVAATSSSCSLDTTNDPDEILNNLMAKYRAHFRKRFRGYSYLTNRVLHSTFEVAYTEIRCTYCDKRKSHRPEHRECKVGIMCLLRTAMLKEFQWIEKINEYKRQMLLHSIKEEVVEEFEAKMKTEFPSAFSDDDDDFSTTFYEDGELKTKVDRIVASVVEDFKKQLPYAEEPEELIKLGLELEMELQKGAVQDLIERNTRNKENAESFMDRLIDHATNQYRDKQFKFFSETPIIEPDQVLLNHIGFKSELMQKYQHEDSRFSNEKMHDQFVNLLNESIHGSLKDILSHFSEIGKGMLMECEKRSKVELDKCLRKIARIFGEYGLSQYFDDLCERIEANLKDSLNEIRLVTIINAEKMEETLETAKAPTEDDNTKPAAEEACDDDYIDDDDIDDDDDEDDDVTVPAFEG